MAATLAAASTVVGLGTSPFSSPKKASLSSGFLKSPVTAGNPLKLAQASGGKFTCFQGDWLRTDLNVIGFGLIGWIAPSSIPVINGKSLTGLFFESIAAELAHFPTPPALTSQFWKRFSKRPEAEKAPDGEILCVALDLQRCKSNSNMKSFMIAGLMIDS